MNFIHSTLDRLRDTYAPLSTSSTFRSTGQITPEEFIAAGDFLVYKFPSWSWADASTPDKRVAYFPAGKQYLVTRGVPCRRRLDDNFAGTAGADLEVADDEGWTTAGGNTGRTETERVGDVRTLGESGTVDVRAVEEEEEIPDMEDEEDDEEAIIRDPTGDSSPMRTYTLYITYTPYYRTPRLYLSGYSSSAPGAPPTPLPPTAMMEDIVGDYKDKTVTLEDFPFLSPVVKTASVHPCRHASVMKTLLDRADAALSVRKAKLRKGEGASTQGMEGLVEDTRGLKIDNPRAKDGDEWEVLDEGEGAAEEESAIRVDQYLIVFLKFMASVTPGIEHDYTMGI